ncbi:polyprenol monophosphomannose synthase [Novipirellula artificiosorum]|uniref:Undecaprenyl-phosphate mannosyltransferase n=1 Tax=Novipirellula artificiosorum TaxID=2528016 RepID=A0A5C6DA89_9BACT|nr:polyprenol monophosphomannose synthase [Novipirellula artificiosorum]TWU33802.1 Undecaprenyl-phosphate mannosyltransferase [Novipirellula artificiosorum]
MIARPSPAADIASHSRKSGETCRVLVGVCTYNEASNILPLVDRIRAALPDADLLIVDDNSPDGTAALIEDSFADDDAIRMIVRNNERGLGGAILRAMEEAIEGEYEFFLNLDGDLSHDPAQLPSLLEKAATSPQIDVVIGSRYVSGGQLLGWPWHRRLMSRLVNQFATLCLRLPVRDCSGSMRCYRVSTLKTADLAGLRSQGYSLLEELLVQLNRQGAKMAEVPITFTDRERGSSKLTLQEAVRSIVQMLRLGFTR